MEETDDAIICYRKAISHGCEDVDVQRSLAYLLSNKEDYSGALKMMSNVVDDESVNVSDVILYGDLARFCGDHAAVTKAVNKFLLLNAGIEETVSFARIVEEAGHPDDAKRILSSDDEPIRMSPSLKKSAEKAVLPRCALPMCAILPMPSERLNWQQIYSAALIFLFLLPAVMRRVVAEQKASLFTNSQLKPLIGA
jgi:hypothetical protein